MDCLRHLAAAAAAFGSRQQTAADFADSYLSTPH